MLALAQSCRLRDDFTGATRHLERAFKLRPTDVAVWKEMAACMIAAKDWDRAEAVFTALHEANPNHPEPCYQLAVLKDTLGEWNEALAWIKAAIARLKAERRGSTLVYALAGSLGYKLGRTTWAEWMWDAAVMQPHRDPVSLFATAEVLLARGRWAEGWQCYEARWHIAEQWRIQRLHQTDVEHLPPEWDGKSTGCVLVCAEQGTGDTLQMLRYVARLSGDVVLQCQPELVPFMRLYYPWVTVVPNGERVAADWSCPIMSLPYKMGVGCMEPIAVERNRERNGALRVGVCWKGSPDHANDKDRSSPIDFRVAFGDLPNVEIVSLQHGEPTKFRDFAATAELAESCDLIVTVDTSVLHLAGTLGIPTICIPPTSPELRFPLTHSDTTPWYPSVTVVRRRTTMDWPDAIARVRQLIQESM